MAIALDSTASEQSIVAALSVTYNHTFAAAENTRIYIVAGVGVTNGTTISSVTLNGQEFTKIRQDNNGTSMRTAIFVLATVVPAGGVGEIIASRSAGDATSIIAAGTIAVTGAHTVSSVDNQTGATSTTTSVSAALDPNAPNSWIFAVAGNDAGNAMTPTGGNTERWEETLALTQGTAGGAAGPFTASTSFGWSGGALGSNWALSMVSIAPLITVNKSESVSVAESTKQQVFSFVDKSESITVTDTPKTTLVSLTEVSDSISVTDTLSNITLVNLVNETEDITISENLPTLKVSYEPSVSDSITLTEFINATLVHNLSVNDSITLTEDVKALLVSLINESENITLTESIKREVTSYINESETITITENVPNPTLVHNVYTKEELGAPLIIFLLPHGRVAIKIHDKFYYPM